MPRSMTKTPPPGLLPSGLPRDVSHSRSLAKLKQTTPSHPLPVWAYYPWFPAPGSLSASRTSPAANYRSSCGFFDPLRNLEALFLVVFVGFNLPGLFLRSTSRRAERLVVPPKSQPLPSVSRLELFLIVLPRVQFPWHVPGFVSNCFSVQFLPHPRFEPPSFPAGYCQLFTVYCPISMLQSQRGKMQRSSRPPPNVITHPAHRRGFILQEVEE